MTLHPAVPDLPKFDKEKIVCEQCKGKPNYLYFKQDDLQILAILCDGCKKMIEDRIREIMAVFGGS